MLRTGKLGMFLVVSSLALGFAAGLAVGQMKPPAENKGLGAEALRSLDLTEEIDSVSGRPLRMRKITLAPGGGATPTAAMRSFSIRRVTFCLYDSERPSKSRPAFT